MARWADRARAVIAKVIADNQGQPADAVIEKIDAAYPFGERAMHPYKAWLAARRAAIRVLTANLGDVALRPCPACGAEPGKPCRELVKNWPIGTTRPTLAAGVYHEARQPSSGSLFAAKEAARAE
jgi:hypothetical protein